MVHTRLNLCSTLGTRIDIRAAVDPTETQLSLYVPMLCKNPGIAVGDAYTLHPALVALGRETRKSQRMKLVAEISKIELSRKQMQAEEMTLESFAQPIAGFRLHEPMAHSMFVDVPGVEIARHIKSPFRSKPDFNTKIGSGSGVIKKVCLQCHTLRFH